MIIYDSKNWFGFLTKHWTKHTIGLLPSTITFGIFSTIVVYLQETYHFLDFAEPKTFITVMGLVIGLLLVFRTNTAYDRWWEGRKLLGRLVNLSRDTSTKYYAFLPEEKRSKELRNLVPAFVWSMKEHLREQDYSSAKEKVVPDLQPGFEKADHKPNYFLQEMAIRNNKFVKEGIISHQQLQLLEENLTEFAHILGGCERIRNTPIPFAYALHLKRILLIYVFTLPFGFLQDMHYWSIPLVVMVFYMMVGIELIGEEIEDPFGTDDNDLPVDELEIKIRKNVAEIYNREHFTPQN